MAGVGNFIVGGQFQVTANIPGGKPGPPAQVLGGGAGLPPINGSAWIEGPMLFGSPLSYPTPRKPDANVMIGRAKNPTFPVTESILKVTSFSFSPTPLDVVIGEKKGPVGLKSVLSIGDILCLSKISYKSPKTNAIGDLNWTGKVSVKGKTLFDGKSITNIKKVINGDARVNGKLLVYGACVIKGHLTFTSSIVGTSKKFDISHPIKPNHRLAHACIEGPENGVYYRGRLTNSNIINLPDYWRGLVDPETITVTLTPHGSYQELYVKSIEWGTKINVLNNSGGLIDCSYTIFAKRKDIADLVVEYEGNEPKEWNVVGK